MSILKNIIMHIDINTGNGYYHVAIITSNSIDGHFFFFHVCRASISKIRNNYFNGTLAIYR